MIVHRVEIEVPGAAGRGVDAVRQALAEMEIPITGRGGIARSGVSYNNGSATATVETEARSPVTAASTVFAIVAGAAPEWRMDHAVIRAAPSTV